MFYPNIKSKRENFFNHWVTPMANRNNFLNRNPNTLKNKKDTPKKSNLPVNVKQEEALFEMEVAMPGFKKSDISVSVNGGILTIRGERQKLEFPGKRYLLQEFDFDVVERKFKMGEEIDKEKIEAKYENGILKLRFIDVPKIEERYVKKIEVA